MKAFLWVLRRVRRRVPALVLMTVSNVASSVLGVLFALATKNVINSAISASRDALVHAILVQTAIILGMLLALTVSRYLQSRLTADLERDWRELLTREILHGEYARLAEFHTGELLNRMNNDVRAVNDGLLGLLPGAAGIVTRLVAVIAVLFALQPLFTGLFLLLGALVALSTGFARRYLRRLNKAVSASDGKVSGFLQESFEKLLLVQAMNLEDEVERRNGALMAERYRLQGKKRAVTLTANTCISCLGYFSGFAALIWCSFGLAAGTVTFGELTAVMQLVAQLQAPFVNLSGLLPKYIAMTASAERLMELEAVCRQRIPALENGPAVAYTDVQAICGRDLVFSYGRGQVLEKSSFSLPKGCFAVITGPSGIGKSTLLKLLLGIFAPLEGQLCLDCGDSKVPVSRNTRPLFAYVPQGNLLFSGTLRENLLLTRPDATEEQLRQALHISCMEDFLDQLPQGLETVLGENAHGLSEGQAQRLSIARAVLGGAPILLLDEVTSALDAATEETVLQRLRQLPGKTCIVVTHRPAAMALADWQLEIDPHGITCQKLNH